MVTWRLLRYESFGRISRRRRSVFSMETHERFPSFPFISKCRKRKKEKIQVQRKVTTLSTWRASAHFLPREWRRETTPHTLETRKRVFIFSKHKTAWSGVTLQLTRECPVESNLLKISKKFIKYAKNMGNLCWKLPQKLWLPSWVMEDSE